MLTLLPGRVRRRSPLSIDIDLLSNIGRSPTCWSKAKLAQFSIYPTDTTHMSRDMAQLMEILDQSNIEYQLGPMSTSVEGDWDQVMNAIRRCHEFMHNQHWRVITTITIDDNTQQTHHLGEMISVVEQRLGHAGNSRAPRSTSQPVDEAC